MRIGLVTVCFAFALAFASTASPAQSLRIASYCSSTGDVCYGIFQQREIYRFELTLAARYFTRYRICVKPAIAVTTCKSFPVRKRGASFGGVVVWNRNYPYKGPGRYKVTWQQSGRRLGPSLRFAVLPMP